MIVTMPKREVVVKIEIMIVNIVTMSEREGGSRERMTLERVEMAMIVTMPKRESGEDRDNDSEYIDDVGERGRES